MQKLTSTLALLRDTKEVTIPGKTSEIMPWYFSGVRVTEFIHWSKIGNEVQQKFWIEKRKCNNGRWRFACD